MTDRDYTIADVAARLEAWAPKATAESYDNPGLQIGRPETIVQAGLVALDLTPAVVQEAGRLGANLIVTHHPLFFSPIKSLTPDSLVGSMALSLAEAGIAHYAIHTNLDAAREGVSFALARLLGLRNIEFLADRGSDLATPDLATGLGALGELEHAEPVADFLRRVATALDIPTLRHVSDPGGSVRKVAVCGGSGSSFLSEALSAGADAYVTADVKYHQFFDALRPDGSVRIAYVDAGHYETEAVTEEILVDYLGREFPGVSWHRTGETTSPIRSFVRE